jgi:ATP/maltotriose-dependent transcriptional regulator MalT
MIQALTSLAGMGISFAGGLMQAEQIRKQTERRLALMRKQRDQAVGHATAMAGASGVEMQSSTIQEHLSAMNTEWEQRIADVQYAGSEAQSMSMLSAAGTAFGAAAQGFASLGQENVSMAPKDPNAFMDPMAEKLNATLDWSWSK